MVCPELRPRDCDLVKDSKRCERQCDFIHWHLITTEPSHMLTGICACMHTHKHCLTVRWCQHDVAFVQAGILSVYTTLYRYIWQSQKVDFPLEEGEHPFNSYVKDMRPLSRFLRRLQLGWGVYAPPFLKWEQGDSILWGDASQKAHTPTAAAAYMGGGVMSGNCSLDAGGTMSSLARPCLHLPEPIQQPTAQHIGLIVQGLAFCKSGLSLCILYVVGFICTTSSTIKLSLLRAYPVETCTILLELFTRDTCSSQIRVSLWYKKVTGAAAFLILPKGKQNWTSSRDEG